MSLTLLVLCGFTLFFSFVTLLVAFLRPDDGQLFTLFAGTLGNFSGALIMKLKVSGSTGQDAGAPSTAAPPPGQDEKGDEHAGK